jgi:hypothetical protein
MSESQPRRKNGRTGLGVMLPPEASTADTVRLNWLAQSVPQAPPLEDTVGSALSEDELTHEQRVRAKALSLLGGRCVVCGEDDPTVLDIDHKLGGGTQERRAGRHHRQLWRALINGTEDVKLYQILCANDHRRKDASKRYTEKDQKE